MTSFYIVPPRKTQLGDNGISISGTLGVITTNPGGAAITGVGALKLDTTYSPTWTGIHTFTQPIIFAGSQVINSTLISTTGQTAGDLFYYTGTSWSRLAVGSNNQILQSFGGGIGWTGGVNLSNVITGNLKIGSLNGVLKASSGIVSGNSGIGDLSNVVLNLPANGNFLKYNGTNWVNSPIPLSDHNIIIRFLNGYTPVQTGIDIEIALVPYEPSDGTTVLEYTITRIIFQVEVAGSTSSQITIERALLGQEFDNPMTLGNTIETLSLGGGVYTVSSTGPFFKIYSGERLRLNINSIGTGAQQWTVQVEGTAGNPYNGTNAGITSINSLAAQLQNMVVGSGGTDFNISSVIDTHTFNIPSASGTNRGLVTTGNQTFAGVKTFNNASTSISTTSGAIIVNGGVGIGETLNVGGNVVVGNNLILNNPIPVQSGGTGLTALGSANSLLAVNNSANALEYKNLIAGAGISINFSSSNITLDVTGSANTGNIGFNNDVIYNTLNNTIYISPSDQYVGYSYIAVPNDNDATVSPLAIGNLVGSIQITSGTSISNSYTWTFNSDGTLSSPYYTFPNNDGANGQALITDGAGNLAWGNVSATGSGGGISSLNGISYINYPVQNFEIGSAGTNFNIVSIGSTHTFNLPEAGSGASGIVTTGSQTFSGVKTFANNLIAQSDINVSGSSNLLSAVGVSSTLNVAGGFGVTGATILRSTLQVQGVASLTNNTNASSSTSGSLVVTGGVGISGALYVGSGANINSNNISGTLTNSGLVFSGNSLTTGTGFYIASSSLTTGKLIDVVVSGNTATGARTGINVSIGGSNVNTGVTTYGILVNNTSLNSGNNIGLGLFASGVTNNIPLRLGLNSLKYVNFFVNSEGNGLTLSPTGNGTPFLAIGGYSGVVGELRLLQSGGFGDPNFVALKSPVTLLNRYDLIFPDNYPSSSGMTLVGTGTTQVTLSWSSLGAGGIGGTINAGDQYKLAFYVNPNGSSVLDDAQALNYSTSGANLTINSTAASVVPLKLVGAVSQTADLLQVATSSGNIFNIDKDGISTFTNNLVVSSTTASTSSSTGALTITGGLGVQGRVSIGTGLSVASNANFTSSVEINTLRLLNVLTLDNGGTGLGTSGLPNQILGMNSTSSSLEYKTINVGFGITVAHSSNSITISTTNSGSGISSLNSLTSPEQTFAVGSSGTNFNIVSSGSIHTFNLPAAGVGSSGVITSAAQTLSGNKSFTDIITASGLGVTNGATFRSTVDIFGGLGVTGAVTFRDTLTVSGVTNILNTTNAASTSTGSLVVSGGVGVGGTVYTNNLYVSGLINFANPLSVSNGGTGSNNGSISGTGALTFSAGGSNTNVNLVPNGTGTVDVASKRITSLATPSLPFDAVNKAYVDQIAQGINYHDHVEAATTAGLGATYQNGVNGIGATLQASPSAGWSTSYSDGVTLTIGDRILVKNQTGAGVTVQNGIYIVSQLTSPWRLTRSSDYDNSIPGSVGPGDTVWVAFGNTLQYTTWTQSTFGTGDSSGGILIGTDPISYIQTSGAGSYNGDGSTISITGSIISIAPGYVGQTSIVNLGTITTGTWNGSVINTTYGGTGSSSFTSNGILYGNGTSAVQSTSASADIGAILTTASSGGVPAFSTTLQGQYTISNNSNSTSSSNGALSIVGGLGVSGNVFFGSNLNVANSANFGSTIGVGSTVNISGGLGVTGSVLFRSSVIIQSGGLGVTGGIVVTQGGLGVTGATTLRSTLSVLGTASFATINQGTWNGSTIGLSYGGTGLGTTGTANQMLGMANDSLALEYKTLTAGSNITITHGANSITISSSAGGGGGSGTVNTGLATQVAYYAVGGTSVSGTANLTVGTSGVGISFATQSTSSTTGSLVIAGGVGVSGNVRVGSGLGVSGSLNFVSGTFGNVGSSTFTLNFLSSGNSPISLNVLSDNSLSFEGSSGQLLSISNNLTTGFIYSINNISGLPLFRANANGNVAMGEFTGNIGVGISNPQYKLHVVGDTNITGGFGVSGSVNVSGGVGITGNLNLSSTLIVQSNAGIVGGLGVTGASLFRSSVIIQSGGLGVTGGIIVTQGGLGVTGSISADTIAVRSQGIGVTGTVTADNVAISGGLGVTGASIFRSSVVIQSGGLGVTGGIVVTQGGLLVTGGVTISTLGLAINSGGLGVTGSSLFRSTVTIQSGGISVTGQSVFNNNVEIQSGGLGVTGRITGGTGLSITGAATIAGSLSASSATLTTALSLSSGGTGLGTTGIANQILGMNNASNSLEYKLIVAGSGIAVSNSPNAITLSTTGGGITSLNSLTSGSQTFATGTSGTEFNIVSSGSTHTFNLPAAGTGSSGTVTTGTQTFAGNKTFNGITTFASSIASTSTSTGSLIVSGGVGIAATSYVGNTLFTSSLFVADNTQSTSSTSGALLVTGGLGVSGRITTGTGLSVQGSATITGTLSATSLTLVNALSISNGGTGLGTSGFANQILGMNNSSNSLEYKVVVAGSGIAVSNSPNAITLSTTGGGITSLNSLTSGSQTFVTGTLGTEFNIVSSGSTHTFNVPAAGTGSSGTVTTGTQTFAGNKTFNGITTFASSIASTSTSTGSLIVSGGVGIAGTSYIGNTLFTSSLFVADNTQSTSSTSGGLVVTGGLGVSGRLYGGTGISIIGGATLNSTVTVNGATILNSSLFTNGPAIIQSGGLGVTGGIAITQGGLGVTGATVLNSSLNVTAGTILNSTLNTYGSVNFASSLNVAGPSSLAGVGISSNLDVTGGLGVTGSSLFRAAVIVQSGGLSVTGGVNVTQGGLGVTGATVLNSSLNVATSTILNSTLNVYGNTNLASNLNVAGVASVSGLGVSANIEITGGLGITGAALFRSSVIVQSGGLGVTGGIVITQGGLGVTGAAVFRSTIQSVGSITVNSNANSTSSTSGAVVVTGGLGVSGNVYVGTGLSVLGSATFRSGTSATGTAPIYLLSGTNLTTPESGALEFDGTYLYFTPSTVRKQISNIAMSGTAPSGSTAGDFWWDASSGVLKIYYDSYWVETTGPDIYTAISNQILSINDNTNSTSSTSGAVIVTGGIGVSGNLNVGSGLGVSGLTSLTYTSEKLSTKSSATGVVTHDLTTGSIFYHSSISNNFTANITNVPDTNDRAIGVTLVLSQGVTAYMATAVQIDGNAQTIKWVNNSVPSGAANKVDVVGFSLIRTGSTWTVLGQYSTYG